MEYFISSQEWKNACAIVKEKYDIMPEKEVEITYLGGYRFRATEHYKLELSNHQGRVWVDYVPKYHSLSLKFVKNNFDLDVIRPSNKQEAIVGTLEKYELYEFVNVFQQKGIKNENPL